MKTEPKQNSHKTRRWPIYNDGELVLDKVKKILFLNIQIKGT